jgi:ADP-ribose pyrophosphatase YjhB (NUDIX family)
MNRRYPDRPLVGVGAVVFRGDHVLLVRRGTEPSLGKWSIPGGLVEVGESVESAVRREVMEEAGLEVEVVDLVAVLDRVIRDDAGAVEYHYILMDFLCHALEGDPVAGDDALDCRFIPIDGLGAYPLTRGTETLVRRVHQGEADFPHSIYDPHL